MKPIRTDARRLGAYLGSYLVKQYGTRLAQDAGKQLVRYARNFEHVIYGDFRPLLRGQWIEKRRQALEAMWGISLRWGLEGPRIALEPKTLRDAPYLTEEDIAREGLTPWLARWLDPGKIRHVKVPTLRYRYSAGLERLLRCDNCTFQEITRLVAEQRGIYGGLEFALDEAWVEWDSGRALRGNCP